MIVLPLKLEVSEADQQLAQWKQATQEKATLRPKVDPSALGEGFERVTKYYNDLSKEVSEAFGKITAKDIAKGLDVSKKLLDSYGESLLGLDKATVKAAGSFLEGAESGAKFGATFLPPMGAIIGGVAGALWEVNKATEEMNRQLPATSAKLHELMVGEKGSFGQGEAAVQGFKLALKAITEGKGPMQLVREESDKLKTAMESDAKAILQVTIAANNLKNFNLKNAIGATDDWRSFSAEQLFAELEGKDTDPLSLFYQRLQDAAEAATTTTKSTKSYTAAIKDAIDPTQQIATIEKQRKADLQATADALYEAEQAQRSYARFLEEQARLTPENTPRAGGRERSEVDRRRLIADDILEIERGLSQATLAIVQEQADKEAMLLQRKVDRYQFYVGQTAVLLGSLASQLEDNVANERKLLEGMGPAAEKGISQVLKNLAREWGARSIAEVALALSYTFTPGLQGFAGGHYASAAAWGAAALAAGGAGAIVGGDASRRQSAANDSSAGGSSRDSTSSSRISDPGPTTMQPIVIHMGSGNVYAEGSHRQMEETANKLWEILKRRSPN